MYRVKVIITNGENIVGEHTFNFWHEATAWIDNLIESDLEFTSVSMLKITG